VVDMQIQIDRQIVHRSAVPGDVDGPMLRDVHHEPHISGPDRTIPVVLTGKAQGLSGVPRDDLAVFGVEFPGAGKDL